MTTPTDPHYERLYQEVYQQGNLFGADRLAPNPLTNPANGRAHSIAIGGGAFGDEGKGRIVDEICTHYVYQQKQPPVVYRWNGGANAGHTVVVDGRKIALHQLPSGSLHSLATVVLGKGMVVHPGDLLLELESIQPFLAGKAGRGNILIDEMAVLSLDSHRAFEAGLLSWAEGGKGATGRGISPAYADVLYRFPVRLRDLYSSDWETRLGNHYDLYTAWLSGLGGVLAKQEVPTLAGPRRMVGSKRDFLATLAQQKNALLAAGARLTNSNEILSFWQAGQPFIFEGAQAVGLDPRFGVYPDITASDPTFGGILGATEGLIAPQKIAVRASAIKATYTSSVGQRRLPTAMPADLAHRIREDAHEYGATTRRPRDIVYIDLPCLRYFMEVGGASHLILTHLDIAYREIPIRVCTHYQNASGAVVGYRPDQVYLDTVRPIYRDLPSWDGQAVQGQTLLGKLPTAALQYVAFITQALGVPPFMGTTGPERDALIRWTE
jgi:adenylosuccinate synthase